MVDDFDKQKCSCLSQADISKKGSIDVGISDLVDYINSQNDYFTTSSCSGRISVFSESGNEKDGRKKNCQWLYVTHETGNESEVVEALQHCSGNGVFKFEAFVLHTQCRSIEIAQLMLKAALESGFRNSGIVIGKKGRVMLAVRSTHGLEVPLVHNGDLLVSVEYLRYVVNIANEKMRENTRRIERFFINLKTILNEAKNKKSVAVVRGKKTSKQILCNTSDRGKSSLPVEHLSNNEICMPMSLGATDTTDPEEYIECLSTFYRDAT